VHHHLFPLPLKEGNDAWKSCVNGNMDRIGTWHPGFDETTTQPVFKANSSQFLKPTPARFYANSSQFSSPTTPANKTTVKNQSLPSPVKRMNHLPRAISTTGE
jgi:hypothetical protein